MIKATHLELVNVQSNRAGIPLLETRNLNVWFKENHILKKISLSFPEKAVTGIIGPSGSGKSTLIRCLNRINDETTGFRYEGEILFEGKSLYSRQRFSHDLRKEIGMIFQKPCTFPKSIFENVLFGLRRHNRKLGREEAAAVVEEKLKSVSLWKEVSSRLHDKAVNLSLGQQQRLCIARALAIAPRVLLMDEPTSALDPHSTRAIEELILQLKESYTIIFVTHNIDQVKRISDRVAFICEGTLIEQGSRETLFHNPLHSKTREYLCHRTCEC